MQLPAGKSEQDIPRALRAKLRHEPVLLPTYGWPRGTTVKPGRRPIGLGASSRSSTSAPMPRGPRVRGRW